MKFVDGKPQPSLITFNQVFRMYSFVWADNHGLLALSQSYKLNNKPKHGSGKKQIERNREYALENI